MLDFPLRHFAETSRAMDQSAVVYFPTKEEDRQNFLEAGRTSQEVETSIIHRHKPMGESLVWIPYWSSKSFNELKQKVSIKGAWYLIDPWPIVRISKSPGWSSINF